ncbi:amidase [Bordetella trematum]|uniref:amidase n=1 Tax=Bordetella trematum TaxID=123899 RepID=UPI0015C5296E|nr:amidase [Bordetella trematum]
MAHSFYTDSLSPQTRVQAALHAIAERDPVIEAFCWRQTPADPLPAPAAGPLQGLAFGVKDVIDVAGMPTRYGSAAGEPEPRAFDAASVAQLRAAGAQPVGKTVTAEFAFTTPGPTRNPRNPAHTPGGSSSGSAAAVAAGMVDMALGTQTGGSMIRPAAFCGVVGFKPTFGRVHRGGMQVLCDSLDTIGWFTRDTAQSRAVACVLLSQSAPSQPLSRAPRVAVLACAGLGGLSPAAQAAFDGEIRRLQQAGAQVRAVALDEDVAELTWIHGRVMRYEIARGLLPVLQQRAALMSPASREVVAAGLAIGQPEYLAQQHRRAALARRWQDLFGDVDFIVAPSAPGEAPPGRQSTGSSVFNRLWSLLGWPCLHLPTGLGEGGLPVGVQWIGLPDGDLALLEWAQTLPR